MQCLLLEIITKISDNLNLSILMIVELSWYQNENVVAIAKQLLGKKLCTNVGGMLTKGIIVETEAYSGNRDKACHANDQKMTERNKVMFEAGGLAYVYLCYGIHHLFNVVTNIKGNADAVLVRAVEPVEGIGTMMKRRGMDKVERRLTAGPGVLSKALGIDMNLYGSSLQSNEIWIEEGKNIEERMIQTTARIGVEYAKEDALKPWRFYIKENKWVSKY